jgi:hypothetical protein
VLLTATCSHTFNISPFTSYRLVIHGVYCKGNTPKTVSCLSVTTYFYVYLTGDLIWTVLLGESDSNSDQLASSTFANDYSDFARTLDYTLLTTTTTRRIRLQLVGFITNRQRLLDFVKNARRHAGDYFDYSFCLQAN